MVTARGQLLIAGPALLDPNFHRTVVLICEHAPHQTDAVRALAHAAGFTHVDVRPDLTGRERALVARR